jgi:hypothetical protein
MRRIDRVKPVRRYRVPRYPSHSDPDPTLHPYPVPFPFRRELLRAAAGFGIAASLGCGHREGAKIVFTDPGNPFLLKQSGLPHQTSPYGTGAPVRVDDDRAREVIDRVFRDEGFSLERGLLYDRDGIGFRTTGFDPKRRVGYVFGGWTNLDESALESWQVTEREPIPEGDPGAIRKWFEERSWMLKRMPAPIREEVGRVVAMEDAKEMATAFDDLRVRWHAELLSLQEAWELEHKAPARKEFVAVISQFDERLETGCYRGEDPPDSVVRKRLELLERNVREYIAWARTQGLQ